MAFIHNSIHNFLLSYGWDSFKDFVQSLFPSLKYGCFGGSFGISTISAFVVHYLGISFALIPCMFVVILTEILTGCAASRKLGIDFESFRFSRCIIKLCIWVVLFYCVQGFRLECESADTLIATAGFFFFDMVKILLMAMFMVENVTSILENKAVLDGKEKSEYVNYVKDIFKDFFELLEELLEKFTPNKHHKDETKNP